jgi:hypothetical protein
MACGPDLGRTWGIERELKTCRRTKVGHDGHLPLDGTSTRRLTPTKSGGLVHLVEILRSRLLLARCRINIVVTFAEWLSARTS